MLPVLKTEHHSFCTGKLAKGCELCVEGRKLVLFVTGVCGQRCFYCPISEHKFGHDVVYANEWKIADPENPVELIEEARLTDATGAGITGGDPLANTERTCKYIKLLKKEFGNAFHIHLYTPLQRVNEARLKQLHDAGLDEIRFHPDLDDSRWWDRISLAKKFNWSVGIEIPAIPNYEAKTKTLIDFIKDKVSFINLNELELSDTTAKHYKLNERYRPKDNVSYGVKGSKEMALEILPYAKENGLRAHFCTAKLKDNVQVKQRLLRRAEGTALPFDIKTEDGTLIRGCAYLPGFAPGANYRKILATMDKKAAVAKLNALKEAAVEELELDPSQVVIDEQKPRLLLPAIIVRENVDALRKLGLIPAVVEEHPTADALEVDVELL